MIKGLTDEKKSYFYKGGYFRYYKFYFPEIELTLTDENIVSESVKLHEAITDGQEFELGGCIASSIEFQIYDEVLEDINGLLFYATLEVKDTDVSIPMGTYRVDSVKMEDDLEYKTVVAYDALYDISADVSKWYEDLFKSHTEITLKAFRESLLDNLEVPYETQDLINDGVKVKKTLETQSGLSGMEVLRMCCVINGGFGKIDRYGFFTIQGVGTLALYPEETLFPSDDLFPEDSVSYIGGGESNVDEPEYYKCQYEEYITQKITSVNIQTENSDVAVESEIDQSNPYLISGNYLLYGKSTSELKAIGHEIYSAIANTQYKPCVVDLDGVPYLETGDSFALSKKGQPVESIIFSRTLSGVQGLKDNFESNGNEIRANEVSVSQEIQTLKGKTLRIDKTVEGVSSELTNFETNTSTRFEQTDSHFVLKVDSDGDIALVELGVDADEGTVFKVKSKNISLTAEQAISLMAGGNLDLKGKNITITSDNFSVDASGNATFGGTLSGASGTFDKLTAGNGSIILQKDGYSNKGYIYANGMIEAPRGIFTNAYASYILNPNYPSAGNIELDATSSYGVVVGSSGYFRPTNNDNMSLGSPSYKWDDIYCTNDTIHTSDIKEKKNIADISSEYANNIIDGLRPSSYEFVNGQSGRTHNGLIAQDVEALIETLDIDSKEFATLCISKDEQGNEVYGLRYQELLAPLIKYSQTLKKRVNELEDRLTKLEREVFKS